VGGGIRSINDIRRVLSAGASRVSLNSAAVKNPQLICDASTEFTSNKIIVAIDALGQDVYINGGMSKTDLNLIEWAQKCEQLGAGEILLTSISGDGMQTGYDIEMTRAVASAVNIPVIASGGCGEIAHIVDVFAKTNCAAALVASLVHTGKATIKQIKEALK
jgi:cyclase